MEQIICKKCNVIRDVYGKAIMKYKNGEKTFHYFVECKRAHRKYIPRTKEVFELVRNQEWTVARKHLKDEKQIKL